ncbi:MAG: cobalamin biosynthesis protein CbiG, partial [Hyphomonadaceae bacterium]
MSRLFQAYVMVDWSAAAKPATGADSIWMGVMKRNVRFQHVYEAHNPSTRAEAESLLSSLLGAFAKRDERALGGFVFPLGFPRGTAAALKLSQPAWRATLDFVGADNKAQAVSSNHRFQVGA